MNSLHATRPALSRTRLVVTAAVKKGDKLPAFSLNDQNGRNVTVKPGGKPKVIFFYPKDATPGCTLEAKAFNDALPKLKKVADVYGISSDDVASHKDFCNSLGLNYQLLADEGGNVRKTFGVPASLFGALPGRVSYVVNKSGEVISVLDDQFKPEKHVDNAIKALGI
jgi:peroxiredoxin Q/BCP